jgi:hypothetical protein
MRELRERLENAVDERLSRGRRGGIRGRGAAHGAVKIAALEKEP